ncbi:MAG TPA: trypsin-like peptidase domain-containing protein [Gemmatimonadales bacterium]|jgi:pSer/pThr/pTyr-binding forkhead associated (FHA) protein/S1-C subfamily serine protease|nr:trypsin-like peptidase domain-containing protein [Gemmatimonadales bacterium]
MFAELRHLDGACAGQTRIVRQEFATLGRHPSATVQFDPEHDLEVSGRHAALFRQGGSWVLRDLGSSNGTWVNDERIQGDRPLEPNDVIRFGPNGPRLLFVKQHMEAPGIPTTQAQPERSEGVTAPLRRGGSTTERIRVEVRRQTAPWRRTAIGAAVVVVVGGLGLALTLLRQNRALEAERAGLLARTDSLLVRLQAASSNVAALAGALQQARQETQRFRGSLTGKDVSSDRLDSLSRELATSLERHEAVLRAAHLDAATIARENGDAIGVVVSEFPGGRRVAGTGFALRVRGDTGWVVTSRHLVAEPGGARAARLGIIFNGSNQNFRAELIALADSADLALLSVRVRGGVPVVRGLGAPPRIGDPVAILGFPFGFDFPMGVDWRRRGVSLTRFAGTVRAVRDEALEVDGYGAGGSSGSPVFNAAGEVTGVIYGGDPSAAGRIVYAVPAGRLQGLLLRLREP